MQVLESQGLSQTTGEAILSVRQVSKRFCRGLKRSLWYGVEDIVSEVAGRDRGEGLRPQEFWALKDVSLEVRRGEAVGLVGANGAGKTTLLRIISGLIKPDAGSVAVRGRVAPLIALGAGFNPILTGRENIFANMAILGLSRREIEERFERVIEFAEIGEAIDAPVQSYSSGMAARLGFASAIFTEPDILLVDEVLAVGDAQFQAKCTRKLAELREKGTAFLLVAHNASVILATCQRAIYLACGEVVKSGETSKVVQDYEYDLLDKNEEVEHGIYILPKRPEVKDSGLKIIYFLFRDQDENIVEAPTTGQRISLCIGCNVTKSFKKLVPGINIQDLNHRSNLIYRSVLEFNSQNDGITLSAEPGEIELRLNFKPLVLSPGKYNAWIGIHESPLPNGLDYYQDYHFEVKVPNFEMLLTRNLFYQPRLWSCKVDNHSYSCRVT